MRSWKRRCEENFGDAWEEILGLLTSCSRSGYIYAYFFKIVSFDIELKANCNQRHCSCIIWSFSLPPAFRKWVRVYVLWSFVVCLTSMRPQSTSFYFLHISLVYGSFAEFLRIVCVLMSIQIQSAGVERLPCCRDKITRLSPWVPSIPIQFVNDGTATRHLDALIVHWAVILLVLERLSPLAIFWPRSGAPLSSVSMHYYKFTDIIFAYWR